jgi:photosynthetic reaction center cytochrome c subunit
MQSTLIRETVAIVALWQLAIALAFGQATAEPKPLLAEDVFKNVQVLKGIPVNEFMETMGFFSASLSYNCTDCHVADSLQSWAKFADDVPAKRTARRMIQMVNSFNQANFGGRRALTCYSCHRGASAPKTVPSLAEQYGVPVDDPNEVEIHGRNPSGPQAEQIVDQYIEAIGGAQRLAGLDSYLAKGTYEGYDTDHLKAPVEVFVKARGQRAFIAHGRLGDSSTVFDGRSGWIAGPDKPVPVLALAPGDDLEGLRLDAALAIPIDLKRSLSQWRAGFPPVTIDDRDVVVVQGMTARRSPVKLYFNKETGLLVRQVRYANTVVGAVPTQIDYSNYRVVAGVKMPFKWTVTWTDGRSTIELSDVQPNIPIRDATFSKPAPPTAAKTGAAVR